MQTKQTVHFIDPCTRMRAKLASIGVELGHHAEVYSSFGELSERPLSNGILVARDDAAYGGIPYMMQRMAKQGIWLPVIATSENAEPERIVAAMKAGALDYLTLPLQKNKFSETLTAIGREAKEFGIARQKMLEARNRISNLSNREREVLDWLTRGSSNKVIARELEISPRTVEIHRANMMTKLGASHAAEAVRLKLEAKIEPLQVA